MLYRRLVAVYALFGWGSTPLIAMAVQPVTLQRASITPAELGVIIAQGDPLSEAIGSYYQRTRGIPDANVVRVPVQTGTDDLSVDQLNTLKAQVDAALPANVQATLVTWTHPFRVQGLCGMSITSALALGYDVSYCNSQSTKPSSYFDSDSTHPWQELGIRPAMMLGANAYETATALIDRGLASEATYPTGDGYFITTTDNDRSAPRAADFAATAKTWNFPGVLSMNYLISDTSVWDSNFLINKPSVLFYFTGFPNVSFLNTNRYVPGAVGDTLTSFGGILTGTTGQTAATEWIDAGLTGSYGTVEEPFAVQDKFPKASVLVDRYVRGATLIEAYWKSVRTPGEGLFLGDPLARPFTDPASSTIENGQYVVRTRALRPTGRYSIEARSSLRNGWTNVGSVVASAPTLQELRGPVRPEPDAQTRLTGPCPVLGVTNAVPGSKLQPNQTVQRIEKAQGGRYQRLYFELIVQNTSPATSNCTQDASITMANLPDGLLATAYPATLSVKPQSKATVLVAIAVPDSVAQTTETVYPIPFTVTDTRVNATRSVNRISVDMTPGTATDPDNAPLLRLSRPRPSWLWTNSPRGTASAYRMPLTSDIRPDSGIVQVSYDFQAIAVSTGEDPALFHTVVPPTASPPFLAFLTPARIAPGSYKLVATGYDADGHVVATDTVNINSDIQINRIVGTSASDTLTGTDDNDLILGRGGADTLTGGGGNNVFAFVNIPPDGEAPSVITDFKPGQDCLDLIGVMNVMSVLKGIDTHDAIAKGLVQIVDTGSGTDIRVAFDGLGLPARTLVHLNGVPAASIDNSLDLQVQQ